MSHHAEATTPKAYGLLAEFETPSRSSMRQRKRGAKATVTSKPTRRFPSTGWPTRSTARITA